MLISFLRHGDASSNSRYEDHERPLTDRGIQQATLVGNFFKQQNICFDIILASPLKRAQQTADIVQEIIAAEPPQRCDLLLNGTDQHQLIEYLNGLKVQAALLVGHIPHLADTISLLINGNYDHEIEMKKCSLAIIDASYPVQAGTGRLKQLIHVDAMTKLIQS